VWYFCFSYYLFFLMDSVVFLFFLLFILSCGQCGIFVFHIIYSFLWTVWYFCFSYYLFFLVDSVVFLFFLLFILSCGQCGIFVFHFIIKGKIVHSITHMHGSSTHELGLTLKVHSTNLYL
jgi:hypothetical protein